MAYQHPLTALLRRLSVGAITLCAAVVVAGCGGSGSENTSTGPAPRLLTIEDLERQQQGTPEAALHQFYFFIQWGSARNLISMIDPDVVNATGIPEIIGAYAFLRPGLTSSRLRIVGKLDTSEGVLLTYEAVGPSGPAQSDSILLDRVGGEYIVRYDSLLERGIPGSILASRTDEPDQKSVRREVARETEEVLRDYRTAAGVPALEDAARRKARAERREAADAEE